MPSLHNKSIQSLVGGLCFMLLPFVVMADPVEIKLIFSQTNYTETDAIKTLITVKNNSGSDIVVQQGFFDLDFHLNLEITTPDGRIIRAKDLPAGPEPTSPDYRIDVAGALRPAVPCTTIADGVITQRLMDDLRIFYDIGDVGYYQAKVATSLLTFTESFTDAAGQLFCFLDPSIDNQSFAPLETNTASFTITPLTPQVHSGLKVHARLIFIAKSNKPPVTKSNIVGMSIKLIKQKLIPDAFLPVNFKTYEKIWNNVPINALVSSKITDGNGRVSFGMVSQDDYVIIAQYSGLAKTEQRYIGKRVAANDLDWQTTDDVQVNLKVVEKLKKQKTSGKKAKKKGP